MGSTNSTNKTFAKMSFAKVYPMYLTKVEKKDRAQAELHKVITWLTGFDDAEIQQYIDSNANFAEFFNAATLNPNAKLITGVICGYRVEDVFDPLTQKVRFLDKLVDELARGRKMEKILRTD